MTVVMLLVCQTRRGDFGYIGGHMQWSYVYVQLSDCGVTHQEAQGLFNLASCNAKSDETRTSIEQLAKAMGLNG